LVKNKRGSSGGHIIRIEDQRVNIHLARLVYRCGHCYGPLVRVEFGLKCQADPEHRGFIHRNLVAQIQAAQQDNIEELESIYQIKDGKVVIKCQ